MAPSVLRSKLVRFTLSVFSSQLKRGSELLVLLRHLPEDYTAENVYGLFPFMTPDRARAVLGDPEDVGIDYEFGRPLPAKKLTDLGAIRVVFNDPDTYKAPYGPDLKAITGNYG